MSSARTPRPAPRLSRTPAPSGRGRSRGFAAVLIVLYGILALAATGRASYELTTKFAEAPLPYSLSLLAAITYLAVTILLVRGGGASRTALLLCCAELAGIVAVGSLTHLAPGLFPDSTVWSDFGAGYGYVPLILPVVAILYLSRQRRRAGAPPGAAA
ncbi:hypothetical protein Bequi_11970 [Brachybacterium sp. JHP9]|uniref:Integral membrane protein n=1 Tax=Brachybacterium equifaecis TaxID=2910770 RepID=A0ABT0R2U3_9MICO|nr:hypothetical protein [Brachybacterium equifaecis]MCL6424085.1 hypothetical protein [Brachybacterium equifaecis]